VQCPRHSLALQAGQTVKQHDKTANNTRQSAFAPLRVSVGLEQMKKPHRIAAGGIILKEDAILLVRYGTGRWL
jgi:hypothetical protein